MSFGFTFAPILLPKRFQKAKRKKSLIKIAKNYCTHDIFITFWWIFESKIIPKSMKFRCKKTMRILLCFFEVLEWFLDGFWSVFWYPWTLENECHSQAKHSFSPFGPSKIRPRNSSTKKQVKSEIWEGFGAPFWLLLPPKTHPKIRAKKRSEKM